VLGASNITGIAPVKVTIGVGLFIQAEGIGMLQHLVENGLVFGFRTIAENNSIRLGQPGRFFDPSFHRSSHGLPPKKYADNSKTKRCAPNPKDPEKAA
jgi:hypothetical protein